MNDYIQFFKELFTLIAFDLFVSRPLGDLIIAPIKIWLKTPENTNFSVNGGGKNHKEKPNFLLPLWVVFLDTDCKINVTSNSQ